MPMPVMLARRAVRVARVRRVRLLLASRFGPLHLVSLPVHPVQVMADGAGAVLETLVIPFEEAVAKTPRRL